MLDVPCPELIVPADTVQLYVTSPLEVAVNVTDVPGAVMPLGPLTLSDGHDNDLSTIVALSPLSQVYAAVPEIDFHYWHTGDNITPSGGQLQQLLPNVKIVKTST